MFRIYFSWCIAPFIDRLGAKLGAVKVQKIVSVDKPAPPSSESVLPPITNTAVAEISAQDLTAAKSDCTSETSVNNVTNTSDASKRETVTKSEVETELPAVEDKQVGFDRSKEPISDKTTLVDTESEMKSLVQPAHNTQQGGMPSNEAKEDNIANANKPQVTDTTDEPHSSSTQKSSDNLMSAEIRPEASETADDEKLSKQSAISDHDDLAMKSIDSDSLLISTDAFNESSPVSLHSNDNLTEESEPALKSSTHQGDDPAARLEEEPSSDTISISESNTVVEMEQVLNQDESAEIVQEKHQQEAPLQEHLEEDNKMEALEESLTPQAGSAADLIVKSASSDGTVIDQVTKACIAKKWQICRP